MPTFPLPSAHINQLAKLLASDQLVLFVGAGISRQAPSKVGGGEQMPLWTDLAKNVASFCGEDLSNYSNNILDMFDAVESTRSRGELEEAVRLSIPDHRFDPAPVHGSIAGLPWNMIVSTNYDGLLQLSMGATDVIKDDSQFDWLSREGERRPRIIQLHGSLHNPHTLTGRDYTDWPSKHPRAYSYLEHIALQKTLLFVGYSFSDPHLKFGLLPWIQRAMGGRGKRHYAWMWDVSPEQIKLFDKRDHIEALPITSDADWANAFLQLASTLRTNSSSASSKSPAKGPKPAVAEGDAVVNGYKLFFHRTRKQVPVKRLSQETGVDARLINNLEQVKTKVNAGPKCFKSALRGDLARIEHALGCVGALEYGQPDDFLATYMMYYKVNKNPVCGATTNAVMDFASGTRAVVFDFGGTLTRSSTSLSTWERMWTAVGYTTKEAGHYHRRFLSKSITHQEWCDITATKLRERGFKRQHLDQVAGTITLLDGVKQTVRMLHESDIALYIVSGSVREIIAELLGAEFALFSEIRANEVNFDDEGLIRSIRGHGYDFEGKAEFIRRVIKDQACHPLEVLFVGNSLNDTWASESGARTLCVNPADVDYTNTFVWTDYIRDMANLREILSFAIKQEP